MLVLRCIPINTAFLLSPYSSPPVEKMPEDKKGTTDRVQKEGGRKGGREWARGGERKGGEERGGEDLILSL